MDVLDAGGFLPWQRYVILYIGKIAYKTDFFVFFLHGRLIVKVGDDKIIIHVQNKTSKILILFFPYFCSVFCNFSVVKMLEHIKFGEIMKKMWLSLGNYERKCR